MYIRSPQLKPIKYQYATPKTPPKKKKPKKRILLALIVLVFGVFLILNKKSDEPATETVVEQKVETPAKPKENVLSHTIQEGDIPAEVFAKHGKLNTNEITSLISASENIYDLTNIKIGQNIDFCFDEDDNLENIKYYPNTESVVVAEIKDSGCEVRKEKIPYEVEETTLSVKIDEFLYKDALDAGLKEGSVLELADIFSFDIDFTTEIRAGDQLKVVYEKRTLDGESGPDGKILAAKFTNAGQDHFGYYFESEGEGSHYDSEGHELVKQFLRAPLSYRKITSGYTGARLHPITKKVTAHYQIDYAAPVGTPVVSTARGTVTQASWSGGWGNIVRIKHDNGYTTHYGHLSKYGKNIQVGVPVSQGQVIGYVGSTGWSTGPHLDYGMKLNGSPINPLFLKLPKGIPLTGSEMEEFKKQKAGYDERLR